METLHNLKIAFRYAKGQKKKLIIYTICQILICIIGAFTPFLMAQQLLKLTDGSFHDLIYLSIFILFLCVIKEFVRYFAKKNSQIFFRETLKKLQIDVANEILKIETKDIDKNSTGVFVERITNDTSNISKIFSDINNSITDIITNIGILGTVFFINLYMFSFFILSLLCIYVLKKIRVAKYFECDKKYRKIAESRTGLIGELIRGLRDIRSLHAEKPFMNLVTDKITELNQARYDMGNVRRIYDFLTSSLTHIFNLIFIVLGVSLVRLEILPLTSLVILYMYQDRIYNLLSKYATLMEQMKDFNLSATRVFEIIEKNTFEKEQFGTTYVPNLKGEIEFKNVYFGYEKEIPIIKNFSFKTKSFQTISFVGKSGSGKSTIFNLLTKMYNINSGSIFIDGIDISRLDQDSLRNNISVITQSPYIFNMTIKDNLKIVDSDLTDQEIIEACKIAEFDEYVNTLKNGYDTLVGESGVSLSGGQRQRLAIARALLHKTNIILFDEATSALDNETQERIQNSINKMRNKYTVLIIAHRLSTVKNSDKIFLIENGQVVCSGNHETLLKKSSEYKHLYELEFKKDEKNAK